MIRSANEPRALHELWEAGRVLWNYHRLDEQPVAADAIVALGSNDLRVAGHAATLYHAGMAPRVVASGRRGHFTNDWPTTEAEAFAEVLAAAGVPSAVIELETESTSTAENVEHTLALLARAGVVRPSLLLVHKPFMERRTRAVADRLCPENITVVTSPPLSYDDYPNHVLTREHLLTAMVGDLDRLRLYLDDAGSIPPEVMAVAEQLKAAGFTEHALLP